MLATLFTIIRSFNFLSICYISGNFLFRHITTFFTYWFNCYRRLAKTLSNEKLMAMQQELIQKAQSKEAYDEIADEIFRLRELRQQTTVDTAARDEQIKRINDLQDYISQQTAHLTEFDESLVRRWVKQITVWDDRITVELKSGVSIDVDA